MSVSARLASRIREVLLSGRWIANTNFKEQLGNTNFEQATKVIPPLNSIALLTFHINYYIQGILSALETGKLEIRDKYSFDMPPVENQAAWEIMVFALLENAERFAQQVEAMPEASLNAPFFDAKYGDWRHNIEGVIEHCYYHLGQVVMLRKMMIK